MIQLLLLDMDKKIDQVRCLICFTDINEDNPASFFYTVTATATATATAPAPAPAPESNFSCHSSCLKKMTDDDILEYCDFNFNNPGNFKILKILKNSEKCDVCDKILKFNKDTYYEKFNRNYFGDTYFFDTYFFDCFHKTCSACMTEYLKSLNHSKCLDPLECVLEDYTYCDNIQKCPKCKKNKKKNKSNYF